MLSKMSELQYSAIQMNPETKRPIGRFLLTGERPVDVSDAYDYALKFNHEYDDILQQVGKSSQVCVDSLCDRRVDVEFTRHDGEFVWQLGFAADVYSTEQLSRGGMPLGGEVYELHCAEDGVSGVYYELNGQRAVLRRKEFEGDSETALYVQGAIEELTSSKTFYMETSHIRGSKAQTLVDLGKLAAKSQLTHSETGYMKTLKSKSAEPGFIPGGNGFSDKLPLVY